MVMELIEFIINDDDYMDGIHAISLVDLPATGQNFVALREQVKLKTVDSEKQILMGAALVPDIPIYRNMDGKEFNMFFKSETVRKASELYLKAGNQAKTTLGHETNIEGATIVESWIVEDKEKDKSAIYGFDIPVGTWMVSMKIDNKDIWDNFVKSGEVKGFSIEAFFTPKKETNLKTDISDEELINILKTIIIDGQ